MPKSSSRKTTELEVALSDSSSSNDLAVSPTRKAGAQAGRIMYIECKAGVLTGPARIGRVTFSKTGRTLYYDGQTFQSLKGKGCKANYFCVETGEDYWISGPKRRGGDALYGGGTPVKIDKDVREAYWSEIRRQPERASETVA
ncbi:MAG TPA: 1-deoxy-D-xylulose-5-phosphate synthase [Verrucomicrobiae bacterium]